MSGEYDMATLRDELSRIARMVTAEDLTPKLDKRNRPMATTGMVQLAPFTAPVPGQKGKVARFQVRFCVNMLNIGTEADYKSRVNDDAIAALAALDPDARKALLAEYAK
jgi:hypothetical protein